MMLHDMMGSFLFDTLSARCALQQFCAKCRVIVWCSIRYPLAREYRAVVGFQLCHFLLILQAIFSYVRAGMIQPFQGLLLWMRLLFTLGLGTTQTEYLNHTQRQGKCN